MKNKSTAALAVAAFALLSLFSLGCATAQDGGKEKGAEVKCPAGIDHSGWDRLLKKYVDDKGLVNYAAWKSDKSDMEALDTYLKQYAGKADKPAEGNEKAASLVNAYNAFAVSTILGAYPVESINEIKKPFDEKRFTVGGETISLQDIENGTLRPMLKYRAHSVLVCAARSCPPLQRTAYKAESFEEQDDAAYTTWLGREDLNKFMPAEKKAEISSIFKWFKADFDKSGGAQKIIAKYAPKDARAFVASADFKPSYLSYNWGLNDQGEHGRNYSKLNLIFDKLSN